MNLNDRSFAVHVESNYHLMLTSSENTCRAGGFLRIKARYDVVGGQGKYRATNGTQLQPMSCRCCQVSAIFQSFGNKKYEHEFLEHKGWCPLYESPSVRPIEQTFSAPHKHHDGSNH